MTYIDKQIKHRVLLEKLKNKTAYDILLQFNLMYPELKDILITLEGKKPEFIIKEINKVIDKKLKGINDYIVKNNISIAKYEYGFQTALISTYTSAKVSEKVINNELARKLVFDNLMAGEFYEKTISRFGISFKDEVEKNIRLGIVNGLSGKQITNSIKGNFNIKRNQLDSVIRTTTQSVVNSANEEVYKNNKNIISRYKYLSILDSRTTDICRDLNNKVYKVGSGPLPPQHFNCRSFTIPLIDDMEEKGYKNYNEFYKRQEDQNGIKSKNNDKFITSDKITLNELEKEEKV